MKKIYLVFALMLTSLFVGAQTFTVTEVSVSGQAQWELNGLALTCPQPNIAKVLTGTFIEAIQQANLGNVKKIVFSPSVSTVDLASRWQGTSQLCASNVSIKADHPVTIIGGSASSYKTFSISGNADTVMNLIFQDGYIELNGTSSYIANNKFVTSQAIGAIFLFNTSKNKIVGNTLTKTGTSNNSGIRIGTNQSETIWGNTDSDTIIGNNISGYWNGIEVGRWNNSSPNCNKLYIFDNNLFSNNNFGAYLTASLTSIIESNFIYGNLGGGVAIDNCTSTYFIKNKVGLNRSSLVAGNRGDGVIVTKGSGNKIGENGKGNIIVGNGNAGPSLTDGIAAFGHGLKLSSSKSNFILGNFIGVDSTTRLKVDGNGSDFGNHLSGIYFENLGAALTDNNIIGGPNTGDGNVIGNNGFAHVNYLTTNTGYGPRSGIQLYNSNGNTVLGNLIGTNLFNDNIGNRQEALTLNGSSNNTIGGSGSSRNIFANTTNGNGIALRNAYKGPGVDNYSSNNIIKGNLVGTSDGLNSLPNSSCGITIEFSCNNNEIGGLLPSDSNIVINNPTGIWVAGTPASSGNMIRGNRITNSTLYGIQVANASTGLVISNNLIQKNETGIAFTGAALNNTVTDNIVNNSNANGLSITAAVKNTTFTKNSFINSLNGNGITVTGAASNLSIRGNTISNNQFVGVGPEPTKGNGIYMSAGSTAIIGGTGTNEGNIITNNATDGISLINVGTNNIMMRRNNISCNAGTGINLNGSANTNYMFDIIRVDTNASTVNSVTGLLKGQTTKDVIVEVYGPAPSCKQSCNTAVGRQGAVYLGTTTTDALGKWTLTLGTPINASDVPQLTATATTPSAGNVAGSFVTSEFSRCNDILPVEFLSFSVVKVHNGVSLQWKTATETNNEYFLVERSTDGVNFQAIGSPLKGAGTTYQVQSYKFLDIDPSEGVNYYRIRQVDFDGKFDFSDVKAVNLAGSSLVTVSPNPNDGHFSVKIISESSELFVVDIYNALGQIVYTKSLDVYGGFAEQKVILDHVSSGVYTLVVRNDIDSWVEKVIKE
jgi:hypothetical protein